MKTKPKNYQATVKKIIDGDTISVNIDLGFDISVTKILRLARINAPEMPTKKDPTTKGLESKTFLEGLLPKDTDLEVVVIGRDNYGRVLAEVIFFYNNQKINLSDLLVEKKFADYHTY